MIAEIEDLQKKVDFGLEEIPFNTKPSTLYDPIRYMLSLGGKRMRPVLTMIAAELFGGNTSAAFYPALGLEVFHNFTLLHDDIMDNAPLRRAQPSVHEKWNRNIAILSGDAMFVKSVQLISKTDKAIMPIILDDFLNTAMRVCEGQQMDMDFEKAQSISIEQYLGMISLKTAELIGCCLKTGAAIAGASPAECSLIQDFGRNIGMLFQLQDDVLDVYGEVSKFGKQPGGDILANKKTYLLLKAFECAGEDQYDSLEKWLAGKNIDSSSGDKVREVTRIYNEIGVRELAEAEMEKYYIKAMQCMDQIDRSGKERLLQYTDKLSMRQH